MVDLTRIFAGDGEMARRMRAFDWAQTPLGPPELYSTRGAMQIKATNLDKQSLEHAAADQESSALSWIGRVMVAPQVRDR
jgi:hypothetical protein